MPNGWLFLLSGKLRMKGKSKQGFNAFLHTRHISGWLEPGNNIASPVDNEFREIPLDIRFLFPVGISREKHFFQQVFILVLVKPFESLL